MTLVEVLKLAGGEFQAPLISVVINMMPERGTKGSQII